MPVSLYIFIKYKYCIYIYLFKQNQNILTGLCKYVSIMTLRELVKVFTSDAKK